MLTIATCLGRHVILYMQPRAHCLWVRCFMTLDMLSTAFINCWSAVFCQCIVDMSMDKCPEVEPPRLRGHPIERHRANHPWTGNNHVRKVSLAWFLVQWTLVHELRQWGIRVFSYNWCVLLKGNFSTCLHQSLSFEYDPGHFIGPGSILIRNLPVNR